VLEKSRRSVSSSVLPGDALKLLPVETQNRDQNLEGHQTSLARGDEGETDRSDLLAGSSNSREPVAPQIGRDADALLRGKPTSALIMALSASESQHSRDW
jgi:hypothetical protein